MKRFNKIKNKLFLVIILIAGIAIGFYFNPIMEYFKTFFEREQEVVENTPAPTPVSNERKFPSGFGAKALKEKRLDLDNDGTEELLLMSFDSAGVKAVLVEPGDSSRALSGVFSFPQTGFAEEFKFKPTETPEIYQAIDLNADGADELIIDLKDYGAYTTTYGILSFADKKLNWVMLEKENGVSRPAIFRDGASVRHAETMHIEEGANRAVAKISGASDNEGNLTWEVEAFSWSGGKYKYNAALSAELLAKQPKKDPQSGF